MSEFIVSLSSKMGHVLPAKGDSPEELVSLAELGLLGKEEPERPQKRLDPWKVKAAMERLHPKERDVLDLKAKGCTEDCIGEILGITQAAVSARLHRAHMRLRWMLVEEGSLFRMEELCAALEGDGNWTTQEVIFLTALWYTTSQTAAMRHLWDCGYESWNQERITALCRPYMIKRKGQRPTRPGLITRMRSTPSLALYARGFSALAGYPPYEGKRRWNILNFCDGCGSGMRRIKEERLAGHDGVNGLLSVSPNE